MTHGSVALADELLSKTVDIAIDGAIQNDRDVSDQSIAAIERLLRAGADVRLLQAD